MEAEDSALCHTGATVRTGMVCDHLVIHLPVAIHLMKCPFMGPPLALAEEGFHGVVVAVESSEVGGDSVDSEKK